MPPTPTPLWNEALEEETLEEVNVDYVGESCLRCGGMGHYARECPTPKGKGKGGFDGKGYGMKGGYKGFGKDGYKGFSKNGGDKA